MAIESQEENKRNFKRRLVAALIILILGLLAMPYVTFVLDEFIRTKGNITEKITYMKGVHGLVENSLQQQWAKYYIITIVFSGLIYLTNKLQRHNKSDVIHVTDEIVIPKAAGEGQYGNSRFATKAEIEDKLTKVIYKKNVLVAYKDIKKLGLLVSMELKGSKEIYYCINEDGHIIIIGGTRGGKTRGFIFQTIWLKAKKIKKRKTISEKLKETIFKIVGKKNERGRSFIATDVKGELSCFTRPFLEENGFEVIELNFREPLKSLRYNFMVYINEAVDCGDIATAIDKAWDLVSQLVGIPKGEPLWRDGQSCVLVACTLTVSMDADKEEFRNLSNVYHFIGVMCKEDDYGKLLFETYLEKKDSHPAKEIFAMAEIAPGKTRASFFTSALSTLNLFTNWNIADMTSKSEFSIEGMIDKPTALFIIIPDEKNTVNKLASLFVQQTYIRLIELANKRGGRLPVIDILFDEFGNIPPLVGIGPMMSAGAGRGIRLTLVIQDDEQLKKNYKEDFGNIKGNSDATIFLKSGNDQTLEAISRKLDTYTVKGGSSNVSNTASLFKGDTSYSNGANLQSRRLLFPHEVNMIKRPYSLFMPTGYHPAILKIPDLSKYRANKELGMGTEEHNEKLYMERNNQRPVRVATPPKYWDILKDKKEDKNDIKQEDFSFLK